MGPTSLARLDKVHPDLKAKVIAMEQVLGFPLAVVQGLRTSTEQAALFAQGRSPLDVVNHLRQLAGWAAITTDENVIVTKAKPGESWHEFALAVDLAPVNADGTIDWNTKDPRWPKMIKAGEDQGLVSGKSFEDLPHFEMTGKYGKKPTDEVRTLMASGGLDAVWNSAFSQEISV